VHLRRIISEDAPQIQQGKPDLNTFCLEIKQITETEQKRLLASAHQLGSISLTGCRKNTLYFFRGNITAEQAHQLGRSLLADPVTESFSVLPCCPASPTRRPKTWFGQPIYWAMKGWNRRQQANVSFFMGH
jgi:hypothetical protein